MQIKQFSTFPLSWFYLPSIRNRHIIKTLLIRLRSITFLQLATLLYLLLKERITVNWLCDVPRSDMHVHRSSEICNLRVTEFSSHAFHSSRYFLLSSFSHFSTDKSLPFPSSSLIHNITQYCYPSIQFITWTIFNRQRLVYVANQLLFLLSYHLDIPPFPFHQIHLTSSFRRL